MRTVGCSRWPRYWQANFTDPSNNELDPLVDERWSYGLETRLWGHSPHCQTQQTLEDLSVPRSDEANGELQDGAEVRV